MKASTKRRIAELGLNLSEFEPKKTETKEKNIMVAPNGDKFEVTIDEYGNLTTAIAESERGMLL